MRIVFWILAIISWLNFFYTFIATTGMIGSIATSNAFQNAVIVTGVAAILSAIHTLSTNLADFFAAITQKKSQSSEQKSAPNQKELDQSL
jgi:hypothetical protein